MKSFCASTSLAVSAILLIGQFGQTFAAPPEFQAAVAADNPVLYYTFNETSGPAINHGSLGAAFNATSFGTPQRAVPTSEGDTGIAFDGVDDYLESADTAPAAFTGNPTFTAEAVFFVPASGTATLWAPFLHWGVSEGTQAEKTMKSVYFSFSNHDANRFFAGFYNGGLRTSNTVPLGQWHHIVWVRQGGTAANLGSILYVDGVPAALQDDPGLPSNDNVPAVIATAFRINRAQDFDRFFTGIIDELVLYDRALSGEEVREHLSAFGSPKLTIDRTGANQAQLSWSPAAPGYRLQESTMLTPASWSNALSGAANPATIQLTPPSDLFRVQRP